MDKELEEQINSLTEKFKIKVTKLVQQATSKALKDQAKSFKEELKMASTIHSKVQKTTKQSSKPRKKGGYDSD
jgi:uncharacterized coiled-coil DUF342 family protein